MVDRCSVALQLDLLLLQLLVLQRLYSVDELFGEVSCLNDKNWFATVELPADFDLDESILGQRLPLLLLQVQNDRCVRLFLFFNLVDKLFVRAFLVVASGALLKF